MIKNHITNAISALFIIISAFGISAAGATLTVTKTADSNDGVCDAADCSLREAVAVAVAGDAIEFASPLFDTAQTVQINGQITIDKNLTITGKGANLTTLQSIAAPSSTSRIFLMLGGTVSLSRMTLTGANLSAAATLPGCNQVCGGAIYTTTTVNLTLNETIFTGNRMTGSGDDNRVGAAVLSTGTLTVKNSSFFNNTIATTGFGGFAAAIAYRGNVFIENTTISGNSVSASGLAYGGAIYQITTGTLVIQNSTIVNNSVSSGSQCSTGGIRATVTARNMLVANNTFSCQFGDTPDVSNLNSLGYNLIGNTTDANIFGDTTGNILNQNPQLAPLGYYGGATPTHALLTNSPALNNGINCVTNSTCAANNPTSAMANDQRGAGRIGNVDIGAFEANNSANGGNYRAVLPGGTQYFPYNYVISPNNGAFTYTRTSGNLPPGISLSTAFAPNAVVALTGFPTQAGTFDFTLTASNGTDSAAVDYRLQMLVPTSASVSLSGRVLTASGAGVRNAVVTLTKPNGETITARTGSFGNYRFDGIEAGQTVIVAVQSKRFSFAPQVVSVNENVSDLDFIAQE